MPKSKPNSTALAKTVVVVDPDTDFLDWAVRHLETPSTRVVGFSDSGKALDFYLDQHADLLISELRVGPLAGEELLKKVRLNEPNSIVILFTGFPTTNSIIQCMKLGAYDFLRKESLTFDLRRIVEEALQAQEQMLDTPKQSAETPSASELAKETIIGSSASMQEVLKLIGRVSRSDVPVLITGESGVGKEVVANCIHRFSNRAQKDFVAINCAAIPDNLLESELFGHEKGSFTGAVQRRVGRFEQCDGGTLFLDEIGDMPMGVQSKILRVLQEGEFSRVGGNTTISTDVRILAATNKNLDEEIKIGGFREDLFYRLNVVRIHIPPLRERREDVRVLADFFLQRIAQHKGMPRLRLSTEGIRHLEGYQWPGNVRELENTIYRACVLATRDVLLPKDIPLGQNFAIGSGQSALSSASDQDSSENKSVLNEEAALALLLAKAEQDKEYDILSAMEKAAVEFSLQKADGDLARAASLLGMTRATFKKRIEKYQILEPAGV
ncbi:MAG: sigma-54 dependent transcriptional regulator [Verrucomicrobiota bacterium]